MNAEQVKKVWASRKLGCPVEDIITVEEQIQYGGMCDTCSYEYMAIKVYYFVGESKKRVDFSITFGDILDELLEIGAGG